MDTPEVKAFNAELSGLYENKPPISKAKMSAITKGAIKAIKFYKHVVHSVEKFIQKCKPEYKVPGLYVIDSIVRQSRHQFGQDKDVFAPRFAKNMQQTFANLFRCPPEDKRNIIRVLNLWQKNNVFGPEVIQPLLDMADPNHPLHQEIQQQQNNSANGSSLNITHNSTDNKMSPQRQDSPHASSPMGGDQFQDEPSGIPVAKFNRKLLNDFEYESEDDANSDPPPQHSHSQHNQHNQHSSQNTNLPQNPADALGSILTNPEIMRQLQSLQAQMQMMTGVPISNLMPMMSDMSQQNQNQNPFLNLQNNQKEQQKSTEQKDDMANESDIEFVETGPQVIEIPDANDSRSPSPVRRHRSRSRSPRRRRRSRSRSPRRRHAGRDRDRERDREKSHKEREAEKEKQREREKKGLPPIKKENLSVCSTTLWVGHLSKLATPEELSDLFGAFGGVASIDVVAPRGCAFVVMERRRDAARAKAKLDKHKLHSKEITVAWAAGKGVKGREWADYWEAGLGVAYLPWEALHARWRLGALSLDALEDGGAVDEETLPPWLPPRILPKASDNVMMVGMGPMGAPMPLAPPAVPLPVPRLPPPGLTPGIPPGMAPGMPPGMRPPSIPTGVPGLQRDGSLPPGPLLGFPPGMPQPGMVGGFLGGLMGMGMGVGGLVLPLPGPALPPPQQHQGVGGGAAQEGSDDAMELDTDEGERPDPPTLTADQIQAMLSKPPPMFNSSEPPPGFSEAAQTDTSQPPPDDRHKDRRDRADSRGDRGDRRGDRDRDRRDRRDRPRERERERDDRRDRDRDRRDRDRGRDRDADRHRDRGNRDAPNRERSREKSPRGEKSLQERLWEMANGDAAPPNAPPPAQTQPPDVSDENSVGAEGKGGEGGWSQLPPPRQAPPMFRAELRMRGPTARAPIRGPWMDLQGPPGPFGPRFNGMGPPFSRPPFERPPFEGPMFERPSFNRMPFDGNRPPFDGPRPNFDGPRPPFDGPRPPFDGPRPHFDGQRPPFDGPRPSFDGPRAPFDSPRSLFDGPRPKFDGPRPPFDGPRPPFDGPRHPFDGPRPSFDGPRPPFDGPRPPFDNNRGFDGDRSFDGFDGPADNFDRGNRRFDDREFDRGWSGERDREWGDRRGEWDDRRRDRRRDDHRRDDRARRGYDRPDDRRPRDDRRDEKRDDKRDDKREDRRDDRKEDKRDDKREDKREERRRDKDRKSRWGAAEAGGEARADDTAEQKDSQPPQAEASTDTQHASDRTAQVTSNDDKYDPTAPNDDKYDPTAADGNDEYDPTVTTEKYEPAAAESDKYESAAGSHDKYDAPIVDEPMAVEQTFENHNDNAERDRREEKGNEPAQMDSQSHTNDEREQDRYTEERNNDRVNDQIISNNSEVEAPKPVLDLYDANESVDTSFAVPVAKETEAKIESSANETDDGDMFSERTKSEA